MCDLIDLNSPNPKKLVGLTLASPLIPEPTNSKCSTDENKNTPKPFCIEKRNSLDNNPFDRVFNETNDYVSRKDDPFESVLDAVLRSSVDQRSKKCRVNELKAEFAGTKRRKSSDILKMNKTLDVDFKQLDNERIQSGVKENTAVNVNQTDTVSDTSQCLYVPGSPSKNSSELDRLQIVVHPASPSNTSILQTSAMNDSLSENNPLSEANEIKAFVAKRISICIDKAQTIDTKSSLGLSDEHIFKAPKQRRSLSHGHQKSPDTPEKTNLVPRARSRSIVDTLNDNLPRKARRSMSSVSSNASNMLNYAFLETVSSKCSTTFGGSGISRLSSIGSGMSIFSTSIRNTAFLKNDESNLLSTDSSTKSATDSSRMSKLNSETAATFLPDKVIDPSVPGQLYEKIGDKSLSDAARLETDSPCTKVQKFLDCKTNKLRNSTPQGSGEDHRTEDHRLVDLSAGNPDARIRESPSISTGSDSVILDDSNIDETVFTEARALAQTFEEMALRSASTYSSGDDLINSRPRWNFDVLPLSDDEVMVDNLIELPLSPIAKSANSKLTDLKIKGDENALESMSEKMKKMELEFVDRSITDDKVKAATVLMDLEKIVRQGNNPQAITLLENLEKVLGVKIESNAQLLATCMRQETNDLSKSTKKITTQLGSSENIKQDTLDKSRESNTDAGTSENITRVVVKPEDDKNVGINVNMDKEINKNEKSMVDLTPKPELEKESLSIQCEKSLVVESALDENEVDQLKALKLITNLSKVLGNTGSESLFTLLANLGSVLNFAAARTPDDEDGGKHMKLGNKGSPKEKKSQVKVMRKQSFDSAVKPQVPIVKLRRSLSASRSQNNGIEKNPVITNISKSNEKMSKQSLTVATAVEKSIQRSATVVLPGGENKAATIVNNVKHKLKKKPESKVSSKKGPLKAVIPIGNMQRRASVTTRVLTSTPPKSQGNAPPVFSLNSSTPNASVVLGFSKQSPIRKPIASSTPDGGISKNRIIRVQVPIGVAKQKFPCNISPVTPFSNATPKRDSTVGGSSRNSRHNVTLSPPKRNSVRKFNLNSSVVESNIPKYTPLAGVPRKNGKETFNKIETSESPKKSGIKPLTPKRTSFVRSNSESQIPVVPLKMMNNQSTKMKPCNLVSKLRRGSSGSNVENKENFA